MNFLEASKLVRNFQGGPTLDLRLCMSGTPDALDVFLKAAGAKRGWSVELELLPFNTLRQWLLSGAEKGDGAEAFLLFPWDYAQALDWRSGVPGKAPDFGALVQEAEGVAELLASRDASTFLVPAATPPMSGSPRLDRRLRGQVFRAALEGGAVLLDPDHFALSSYLGSGSPFAGRKIGSLAEEVVGAVVEARSDPRKILVTDLDNVMWAGVVGEDGVEGIECEPQGRGFPHFIYQSMLARLEAEGILLAAVSRNDEDIAAAPFEKGRTVLDRSRFVAFLASYEAKSAQIASLSDALNLPLRSFVFVDDNPVELAEVSAQLPDVACIPFPEEAAELPALLETLNGLLRRERVTDEDRERTRLYRRRLEGMAPSTLSGADLTGFLDGLEMELEIHDRSRGDRERAVQLINKTNQFNLNGRRLPDEEVAGILAEGGRLFTAALRDRTGAHGEILSCLIGADGVVESLVLSCRVFQRRVEHAFLCWLAAQPWCPGTLRHEPTERNEPFRRFIDHEAFPEGDEPGLIRFEADRFVSEFGPSVALFEMTVPEGSTLPD